MTTATHRAAELAEQLFAGALGAFNRRLRLGFSTVAVANALLDAHVDRFDLDAGSIADARNHAEQAGAYGRVRFLCADAASLAGHTAPTTWSCCRLHP